MRSRRSAALSSAALALALGACAESTAPERSVQPLAQATASSDVTAPTLTALSIVETSINTTLASATVTVNYTITDDVGVVDVSAGFDGPDTQQFRSAYDSPAPSPSTSGSVTFTFPRYADAGTWQLVLNIGDAAGNYRYYTTTQLIADGFPTDVTVISDEDVTPPVVTAVSFSPVVVNTATGDNVVTVTYTVTDDKAGTVDVSSGFQGPSPQSFVSGYGSPPASTNYTGTFDVTIPQGSELGTWQLVMNIGDAVGNYDYHTTAELAAAGFPTDLEVVDADRIAPTLTAITFSAGTINTTLGSATVTVSYTVTDDLSGAREVSGGFQAPHTNQFHSSYDIAPGTTTHSGSFVVSFPRYSDAGTWKLVMNIGDMAGNYRYYTTADLAAAGLPTDLTVVSDEDITPPTLTAVSFTPIVVNTSSGDQIVSVTYTVTDDKAGTVDVSSGFQGPSSSSFASGYGSPPASTNFTGSFTITIPRNSETGTWRLVMNIGDAVGNYRYYTSADLAAGGFPTDLAVVIPTVVRLDIKPSADPNTWLCRDTKGNVPVAVLSSATFDATTADGTTLRFGRTGTEALATRLKNGTVQSQVRDVDRDGRADVIFQFRFGDTGFSCADIPAGQSLADVVAVLTGLAGGVPIEGSGVLQLKRK
jgi:hypothetical protein